VPIERRRKPSAARKAKRGFLRASGWQDARSERPARWHGQPRFRPGGGAKIRPARAPKGPGRPFSSERGRPGRSSRAASRPRGGRKAGAKEAARGRSAEAPRMEPPGHEHPCRSRPRHGGLSRGPSSSWRPSWQPSSSSWPWNWLLATSILPRISHPLPWMLLAGERMTLRHAFEGDRSPSFPHR